jgi:TM2 domain-containing membrane protein YozV
MKNPEATMSEKTAERAIQRTSPVASEIDTSLTAEQRAERELAKLDEGMDLIMAKPENRAALVNAPGQALQPPGGRSITPSVSAPVEQSGINLLAMNCFVPGLGTLVRGSYLMGLMQLGLALGSIPVLFVSKLWIAVLMAVFAYAWSVATGLKYATQSTPKSWK